MMTGTVEIKNRFTNQVIKTIDAETLVCANLRGADLWWADLRGADLDSADLHGANLRGADLRRADLYGANLRRADLRGAELHGASLINADLCGADLYGANLRGANLREANLDGTLMNWKSHALIAELLRRAAVDDIQKRMIAGLVAVSLDWCWSKFLDIPTDLREWALDVLKTHVREGDYAPAEIRPETPNTFTDKIAGVAVYPA
jgi:hypothetical protein